ncbi:hypothetical protein I5677_07765 [Mobilitalea sibirica]|uniref:Nephrocystin 3-like N-terminal domain-containing protein n=1 Tax=Mobilitalea sibirica TaxID=1462919 RepID=A0A8J7HB75_9FIRM|nr:hypothetical protein [Mobilitalea sibirica]MBH1940781.1 hypothetical protein [Mobilitalea sibirica]
MPHSNEIQFFLGSNTKQGFVPLFDDIRDPVNSNRLYILKGGPGSGKSSLMRRIAKTLEEHSHRIEYIPCASDPQSLDAFIDYNIKIAMVDGTAPHTLDPKYPGTYDTIINVGDAWDADTLTKKKHKIIELSDEISACHSMATSCIASAAALLDRNKTMAKCYIDYDSIQETASMICDKLKPYTSSGKEHKRLLSAVSVGRTVFFEDTVKALCTKVYVIEDEWGAASDTLLSELREFAILNQIDVITCYCSVHTPEKIDHLLFPSAKTGIITSNSFHPSSIKNCVLINGLMRSLKESDLDSMTKHLSIAQQLIETASQHVLRAKELHDDLEAYYISAMDFSKVDTIYKQIMSEINVL